jgi:hypothetical protein
MKTNKVKALPAAIQSELGTETITLDASVLIHQYDVACYAVDDANLAIYNATKGMHGILDMLIGAGYKTLQSGHNKKRKLKPGEFPYTVAAEEFKTNYLVRHESLFKVEQEKLNLEERTEYVAPNKANVDNVVKQKISTLSFFLDYGRYTTNVGKDKPRLMAEIHNEKWLDLLQERKEAEAEALRLKAHAAKLKLESKQMQNAAALAAQNNAPAPVIEKVSELVAETLQAEAVAEIAAGAAQNILDDITDQVNKAEELKNASAEAAEIKKTVAAPVAPSAATLNGVTNHDASKGKYRH